MFSLTNLSGRIRNHEQNPIHTEQMARFARCYVHWITIGCNQTSAQLSNASGVLDSYLCLCLHCTDVVFRIVLSNYARSEDINDIHYHTDIADTAVWSKATWVGHEMIYKVYSLGLYWFLEKIYIHVYRWNAGCAKGFCMEFLPIGPSKSIVYLIRDKRPLRALWCY